MEELFQQPDDATPLSPEEILGLKPAHIAYRRDLNEAEQENIARGQDWALARRRDLLSHKFVMELHQRMFGDVWLWAGKARTSEIPAALRQLLDEAKAWLEDRSYAQDEIAVRLHHRLVQIHPFPNGNGRHARLMADLLIMRCERERFSWGSAKLHVAGDVRRRYITALRAADNHDLGPLLAFARS